MNPWLFKYVPGIRRFGALQFEAIYYEVPQMRKALELIKQIEIETPLERFVVYYVPSYEELLEPELFDRNITLFHNLCGQLVMRCSTIENILKDVPDPSELYLPTDGHLSKCGSSLVADQIYEILFPLESNQSLEVTVQTVGRKGITYIASLARDQERRHAGLKLQGADS